MSPENELQNFTITVRVGRSLTYETTGPSTVLLNPEPASDPHKPLIPPDCVYSSGDQNKPTGTPDDFQVLPLLTMTDIT